MRLLHTMLRVKNLEESTKFYTEKFGMQVVRALDDGAGKRIAFVGYGDEKRHTLLELQYAPDKVETIRLPISAPIEWGWLPVLHRIKQRRILP